MFSHTNTHSTFNNGGSDSIKNWTFKTTGTINFSSMFSQNSVFNQPIGSWNTSRVTNMQQMFYLASAFNQNIGSWDISNVEVLSLFMTGKTAASFSVANLDSIYNGWSSRSVKPNITINFGTAKRTSASTVGKAILTDSPNNWVITDGGI
jgi:surface protein